MAQEIYDSMPSAKRELVIIPGAPHFLSWTHAQEVNDVVVSFLDRITGVDSEALGHLPISKSCYSNFLTTWLNGFGCIEDCAALHKKTPFWKKLVI